MTSSSSSSSSVATATAALDTQHRVVAIDCERVQVDRGGYREDALARCSLVSDQGVLLDTYVRVCEPIRDYRTEISGIKQHHIESPTAMSFSECQKIVQQYIQGTILVGHEIQCDLECLKITHPISHIRDTSLCPILCPSRSLKLRELANKYLNRQIQNGPHDSIEDAKAALHLYDHVHEEWETLASQNRHHRSDKYSINHHHRSNTHIDDCFRWDDCIPDDEMILYQD